MSHMMHKRFAAGRLHSGHFGGTLVVWFSCTAQTRCEWFVQCQSILGFDAVLGFLETRGTTCFIVEEDLGSHARSMSGGASPDAGCGINCFRR